MFLLCAMLLLQSVDKLEQARKVNLDYVGHMPNFVADETAKRYASNDKSSKWRPVDTIETEITFKGNEAVREHIRRDGKPWSRPFKELPGFKWYGGFGTELRPLFDPACQATIEYAGRAETGGRPTLEYRFDSPPEACFATFFDGDEHYSNPSRTGHVFIEENGGHVLELDEGTAGLPADFAITERKEQVWWDYVKIGDDSHLLPVRARFEIFYSSGGRSRIEVEYRNHRHFEASTNVTFQ